jgi:predicted amidohydrolase
MARYVTVSSVSHRPEKPIEDIAGRLEQAGVFITRAARMGAEIIAFPEIYIQYGMPKEVWREKAEVLPGETCAYIAELARKLGVYIIWPLVERAGDRLYNSSVLIGRQGEIVGVYHKMFPTIGEMDASIVPGTEASVFQTDFGKVGLCICFDLNFRPIVEGLVKNGAEIIFFSSMYRGGLQMQSWAQEFGVYFVSAIDAELGMIVDQSGKALGEATYEAVICRRINLDRRVLHMDYNWGKMDAMLAKYGRDISFDYFTREARYAIASEREGLTVDDLIREFELETLPEYWRRATSRRDQALVEAREK